MLKRVQVTIRMGWISEFDSKESSAAQIKEELQNQLHNHVPPHGKLDIDVRHIKEKL